MNSDYQFSCISLSYINQVIFGDLKFASTLLHAFELQMNELLQKLQSAQDLKDVGAIKKIVHTMKSSFAIWGISSCDAEFRYFEELKQNSENFAEINDVLCKITHVYDVAFKEICIFIEKIK